MDNNKPKDDEQLVARLREPATCREAFGDVMRIYSEPLYWQIRRIVVFHDDADDVLQSLDTDSEDYATLDAAIVAASNLSEVTTVAELEAKVAAITTCSMYSLKNIIRISFTCAPYTLRMAMFLRWRSHS